MKILNYLFFRIIFFFKFKTLKKYMIKDEKLLILPTSKGIFKIDRYCPHQNAPLEKAFIKDNIIVCHWHGCKMQINRKGIKV
tara:strand:+ start:899 stop:1144 length:246 start_codon:yes stop_codon:yes gene_type:complete